jgi:hypothetical protein
MTDAEDPDQAYPDFAVVYSVDRPGVLATDAPPVDDRPMLVLESNVRRPAFEKPKRGGDRKGPEKKLALAERVKIMIEWRVRGLTWAEIAEQAEYGTEVAARRAVKNYLRNVPAEAAAELRNIENQRYEKVQETIWPRVLLGDLDAIDRFLRLSRERRSLNGLDLAPKFVIGPGSDDGDDNGIDEKAIAWRRKFANLSVEAKQEVAAVLLRHMGDAEGDGAG